MAALTPIWPPVAGYYAMPIARGGMPVAVRIWFGHAIIDGEEQDRGLDWRCEIDGEPDRIEEDGATGWSGRVPRDVHEAWPFCARHAIDEKEYRFLLKRAAWAREHQPDHPAANPRQRIDVRSLKPGF